MRFSRCPWPKDHSVPLTPRRIAAARRRLARERDAVALLPDLVAEVPTLEQDLARTQAALPQAAAEWRDHWAASWRKSRRRLAALPDSTRRGILRYWSTWGGPTSPEYLTGFIFEAEVRGRSYWTTLRKQRQLWLIGQKRFPQDRIEAVFAADRSTGKMDLGRTPSFYLARRKAKQARRAGQRVVAGRSIQMGLQVAANA